MTDCFNDFIAPKFGKNLEFPSSPCTRATGVLTRCDAIGNGLQDSCHPRVFLSPNSFFDPLFINFLEKLYNFCSKKLFVPICLLNDQVAGVQGR